MSIMGNWLKATFGPGREVRESGRPPSANGASSMHAHWLELPPRIVSCSVDITVTTRPTSDDLHFWALQASFVDGGRRFGAGHFGLQHYPQHPGSCAVNWGGYHSDAGGELSGTTSPLPSAANNVNTRDCMWSEGVRYRYDITQSANGWTGTLTDTSTGEPTTVRELFAPSSHLGNIVMWSEVFARCEGPSSTVRWQNATVTTDGGTAHPITAFSLTYQAHHEGGCSNTSTTTDRDSIVQTTATTRVHEHGAVLKLN